MSSSDKHGADKAAPQKKTPVIVDEMPKADSEAAPVRYQSEVIRRLYGLLAVTLYAVCQMDSSSLLDVWRRGNS